MYSQAALEKRGIVGHNRVLGRLVRGGEIIDLIRLPVLDNAKDLIPAANVHWGCFTTFRRTHRGASEAKDCTSLVGKPIEKNTTILSGAADDEGPSHVG